MADLPLVRFRLAKPEPWLLSEFSVFMTPGGKLTSIVFNKEKKGTPSEATIRKLLEPIATEKRQLPTVVPFFIDVVSSINDSKNLLLVYRKTGTISGRYEFKLVSVYSYRKESYVSAVCPLDDLNFELSFFTGRKLVTSIKLSSFHFESNEMKKMIETQPEKEIKEKDTIVTGKFTKSFRTPVDIPVAKKLPPQPQKRNHVKQQEAEVVNKIQEPIAPSESLSHYPQLLGIVSQIASLDTEALVVLKERLNSIMVLKEASLILKTIREKNLTQDHILMKQALLLGELMQKEKPEISEIEKFITILKSLLN